MSDEKGYNGWSNYETWSVALIIDNDESTYRQSRELVTWAIEEQPGSDYWTEEERRRFRVADALKQWIESSAEVGVVIVDDAPFSFLWSQLVSAALSDVDWDEIARHYVEDYEEAHQDA